MDTFKCLFLELVLTNLLFTFRQKDVRNMAGGTWGDPEDPTPRLPAPPKKGDVKQKYIG